MRYRYNEDKGELGEGFFTVTSAQVTRSQNGRRLLDQTGIQGMTAVGGDSLVSVVEHVM